MKTDNSETTTTKTSPSGKRSGATACSLSDSEAINILEGACWNLRTRFTDDLDPHENYEWVVESGGGLEMGVGGSINIAVQRAYEKMKANDRE